MGTAFLVLCGVRQGGTLSPFLFAVYVDDLSISLKVVIICMSYFSKFLEERERFIFHNTTKYM